MVHNLDSANKITFGRLESKEVSRVLDKEK